MSDIIMMPKQNRDPFVPHSSGITSILLSYIYLLSGVTEILGKRKKQDMAIMASFISP